MSLSLGGGGGGGGGAASSCGCAFFAAACPRRALRNPRMPAKNPANSGGAQGKGSGVAVSPRQERSEAVGAAAAAEGRSGSGAERSSAAPQRCGGIGRWREEREANGSARDTMRAMALLAVAVAVAARVAAGPKEMERGSVEGRRVLAPQILVGMVQGQFFLLSPH